MDESDSYKSEREHPDDTDVEETDLGKTESEELYGSRGRSFTKSKMLF